LARDKQQPPSGGYLEVDMINWVKSDGSKLTTNEEEANINLAKSLGYERKKGRKPKAEAQELPEQ